MSGVCIDKLPHSCGSQRGLQVFADPETGKVDGFCFSCSTIVRHPYGEEKTIDEVSLPETKTTEQIQEEISLIERYPVVDLKSRKLRANSLDEFGIKVGLSESDGKTPEVTYFPMYVNSELSGYYAKTLDKPSITWAIGEVKDAEPFGWEQARKSGAYKLIIVEGKEDAVAVKAIFGRYNDNPDYMPAVISLSNGTNSVDKCLSKVSSQIKRLFKEVVICFDDDEAGHKAVQKAMMILPKAKTVVLPENDANDCIIKGAQKAAYKALSFQAATPKNTRLVMAGDDLHAAAREPARWGDLTWPYDSMNELLRGIRYGETIYIGAGTKMGKSELVDDLSAHFIKNHEVKVFMAKPEQPNKNTYKKICGKLAGKIFDDPKVEFDYEAFDKVKPYMDNKLYLLDLYQHIGWESLKSDIISAAAEGVKVVFIDPITNLTAGMPSSEANTKLQEIAVGLSSLALDLNIVVFLFCHLNSPDGNISLDARQKKYKQGAYYHLGNCPHERGGDVLSSQFAGSRAMMRSCNLMIGLEGNKDPELDEEIRNTRWLSILEDREFGNSSSVRLFWNKNTTLFKEY